MTAYATRANLYQFGLPRGALGNPGRVVASSLASTSTIELFEHGFVLGDAITFRITDGGVLSAPLVAGTVYYAVPVTDSTFCVSTTPDGTSPVTFSTDGDSMIVSIDLPVDELLERYSRFVDGFLPAHVIPLPTPYPITVVATVAELTAKKLQILSGLSSESMRDSELSAKSQLERWASTLPVRDAATGTVPANLAVHDARKRENRIGVPFGGQGRGGLWGSDWE